MTRFLVVAVCLAASLCGTRAAAQDDKLDYLKKLSPEVVRGYTLDELCKAHKDAKKQDLTRNADGSQELIWGDNLVNHQAMLADGKVLLYRRKVIRVSKEAAEKEALAPKAELGKPKSTGVPDDEPDVVSCNIWIEQGYWVRTAVVRGKTVKGGDVFFSEVFVMDLKGIDKLRKK